MAKPPEHRTQCNPYCFLLLKREIEFEFTDTLEVNLGVSEIDKLIRGLPSVDLSLDDNYTLAEYIRSSVWNVSPYYFVTKHLDGMCKLVTKLGNFQNWLDFKHQVGKFKFAQQSEVFTEIEQNGKVINPLIEKDKKLIQTWVERDISEIVRRRRQEGYLDRTKYNLEDNDRDESLSFRIGDPSRFKYPDIQEIRRIENLAKRVYPCPINDFDVKMPWLVKNPKIFIMYEDDYGELIANLNVLPLKETFYLRLKNGLVYEDVISASDIYSLKHKDKAKVLYIEGFASLSVHVQHLFRFKFPEIVAALTSASDDIIICAIGGSKEGDNIMKRAGFKQTSTSLDNRSGEKYPFFETTWKDLKKAIQERIADSPLTAKQ